MKDNVIPFSVHKALSEKGTESSMEIDLPPLSVGDGLIASAGVSTEEDRHEIWQSLAESLPDIERPQHDNDGLIEFWREGRLVGLCELKGKVKRKPEPHHCENLNSSTEINFFYALPEEDLDILCRKLVMVLYGFSRRTLQSLIDGCSDGVQTVDIRIHIRERTKYCDILHQAFLDTIDDLADDLRVDGKRECHCSLAYGSELG